MEEKNNIKVSGGKSAPVEKVSDKLSYEQLEAYASQTTEQAKRLFQENQMLKKALYDNNLKEVEIALKCLDHANMFSNKFITAVVAKIEEIMTPQTEEVNKEEVKEENK